MKRIFILTSIIILGCLLSLSILTSCEKDETMELNSHEQQDFIENKLEKRYGYTGESEHVPLHTVSMLKSTSNYASEGTCLNFIDETYKIYAFELDGDSRKQALFEAVILEDGTSDIKYFGEIFNSLDKDGNGYVKVTYSDGNTAFYKPNTKPRSHLAEMFRPRTAYAKFCQREEGEDTKDCYDREADEFQSDFISIVAWNTSKSIAILVAVMCTC